MLIVVGLSCGESSAPSETKAGAPTSGTTGEAGHNGGGASGSANASGGASGSANGSGGSSGGGGSDAVSTTSAGRASDGAADGAGREGGREEGGTEAVGSAGNRNGGSGGGPASDGGRNTGGSATGGSGGSDRGPDASVGGGGMKADGGPRESASCPSTKLAANDVKKTVTVGGASRTYILHVPSAYKGDTAVPLIVDFHGLGGDGSGERGSSTYPKTVDAEGVVMAFPDGLHGPGGNAWNVGPCCVDNVDDVAFAKAIVADVEKVACIDPKRVYAVGFSMGGGMSHYLACHAADVFAAVAPAAFDLLEENVGTCKPPRPLTVFFFRGTSDSIVPYAGGASNVVSGHPITFLGAVNTLKKWAEINHCTGSATDSGGGCQTYSQCDGGVQVTLCTKQDGSHEGGDASKSWPVIKKYTLP